MTSTRTALFSSLLMAFTLGATAAPLSKMEYQAGKAELSTKLKTDKMACDALTGNAKDICVVQAKGVEKVAMAELEAAYEPSTKHTYKVHVAKAKADLAVAKEKCDDQKGNPKAVCRKEAEAAYTSAMAKSKLNEQTKDNNSKAAQEINDAKTTAIDKNSGARKAASTEIRDADYKTAIEKCDAFAGDVKAKCVAEAKMHFSK